MSASSPASPPRIVVNGRQLRDIIEDLRAAFLASNSPPTFFRRGDQLCRFEPAVSPDVRPVRFEALYGEVARRSNWVAETFNEDGDVEDRDARPDRDAVRDLIGNPDPQLPPLERIVSSPVFASDGSLIFQPGYDRQAGIYLVSNGSALPSALRRPTSADVEAAKALILDDLLVDFPFHDQASRAHTLALLLLHPARGLIEGPTPLHMIESSTPGIGKGLLASLAWTIPGERCATTAFSFGHGYAESEVARKLSALLFGGASFILIDNVADPIDSPHLASALTSTTWGDRQIKTSTAPSVPNHAIWIATGNNISTSTEIARRTIRIRLDAQQETPWTGRAFRHSNLPGWIAQNRPRLLEALVTLVQAWLDAGRPLGSKSLGSFESWSSVMGGILDVAEVSGFLEHRMPVDTEREELEAIMALWWATFGPKPVKVGELLKAIGGAKLPCRALRSSSEPGRLAELGNYLAQRRDRIVDGKKIEQSRDSHSKTSIYRLVQP